MQNQLLKHNFPKGKKSFVVKNPANGNLIATLPEMEIAEVKKAINKTHAAFPEWSGMSVFERGEILHEWYRLIIANKKKLAEIMTAESGKLMVESLAEIDYAASFITWSAEEAKRAYGEIVPMPNKNRGVVIKQPVGTVAAITPWNFPAAMITRKTAPALAAGCTVICKPPKATPLTAIALSNLARKAGMPDNVFTLVVGDSNMIGKELAASEKIRKLSFTGSTEVGRILLEQCAPTIKKTTMELGGNAPFIVFADADIEKAVNGAIASRFRFSGQTCVCANRFLVHEKIHDKFAKALAAKVKTLKIAPLINGDAIKKVDGLVKNSGGKILCGGKFKGNYYEPTVISNLKTDNEIFHTEIFGPVATIFKFKTDAEAIKLANDTPYGLAAYLYSGTVDHGWKIAEQLDFGMIGVNESSVSSAHIPFGGMKHSGIGREGSHYGLEEYLEVKYLNIGNN